MNNKPDDLPVRVAQLRDWARSQVDGRADVANVVTMPGHAGLTVGFDVTVGGRSIEGLVIRFAPPGVRRSGNTDVLRQVPLLTSLARNQVPVAELVWSTSDPRWFGTDCIVQRKLDAAPFEMFHPADGAQLPNQAPNPYLRRAMRALALIHSVNWQVDLADWQSPRSIADEVAFWRHLLGKTSRRPWIEQGSELARRVVETDPGDHVVGIFHGDYHTNNILFDPDDGRLVAVIDWEISGIGAVGLDVGWMAMMCDPTNWPTTLRNRLRMRATPEKIFDWYAEEGGHRLSAPQWYTALACFRYGSIAAFNAHLHRQGRRVDEFNATMADAVPLLFGRGLSLLRLLPD